MANRLALASLLCASVCLVDCSRETAATAPTPDPSPGFTRTDSVEARKDTVDSRKELARLATGIKCLPMPMGTRYNFIGGISQTSDNRDCRNGKVVHPVLPALKGIYGIDSISYIDSLGEAHCMPQGSAVAESHVRYLLDTACGEAWERIQVEISPDSFLTKYRSHGTGRLRLLSGLEADIEAYELDLDLDHSMDRLVFRSAHLRLAVPGGYRLQLELVDSSPFQDRDFFSDWQIFLREEPVMAGPVFYGADTVGHAYLYADRTLEFLDTAGVPITPR